ncbi:MAG: S8 family serine peptidase, partial [Rhodothermales bacterium]|nr:S8 family serine peptidase [Rhodothermales bacterium]
MTSQNSVSYSIRRRLVGIVSFLPVLLIAGNVAVAQERDGGLPPIPRVFPGEQNAEVDVPSWATANKPVHSINLLEAAIPDNDRTDYFAGAAAAGTEVTDLIDDSRLVGAGTMSASSAGAEILGNQFVRVEPPDLLKSAPGDQMNSAIVSDPQNNLYAAYEDRNVFLVSQNGDTTVVRGIRVIKSTDLGRTWTYLLTLGERGEYLTGPSIAYAQGFVFVSYVRSNGNLTVFRKPVSGWSGVAQFSPPVPGEIRTGIQAGSRWVMRARIVSDSKLFESTGNSALYLAYVIAKKATLYDTVADLYLTRSLTLGDDWTQPQALVDDNRLEAYEEYRAVGMDVGGSALQPRLHVAYSYRAGGALELHSTTSTDFGATFPPSTVIATQESGHMYSIDVSALGPNVVTSVTRQAVCVFSCYSEVMTWYTNNGGQIWNPNRIAIQAAHADVSHDGDGNFYAVYWKADGTELLEAGQATPLIGSPPVELSPSESRGLVFEADPAVTGFWSGAGAMTTYSVSTEPPDISFESTFFTEITGNRIVPFSEADISLAPRAIDVFQGASPPASVVPDPSWPSAPGRAVVAVEKDVFGKMAVDLTDLHRRAGITGVTPLLELAATANGKLPGLARGSSVFVVEFDAGRPVQDVVGVYQSDPNVLFAEPDYLYERDAVPNDPLYTKQWALRNTEQAVPYPEGPLVGLWGTDIDAERAWDISTGSPGVVVAVIDDGVDASHPEFAGRVLPGYDFASDDSDAGPEEGDGHGTAVAGIIAAAGNNGIGVAGVAWGVGILPVRVFDRGSTSSSIISRAIIWSADQGASVINMSLGGPAYSRLIEMAVDYAHTLDALVVSAAGNGNIDNRVIAHYPAGYRNSMSIGALSPCNTRKTSANSSLVPDGRGKDPAGMSCDEEYWWGSHFGDLDVLAPGTRIHTTDVVGPGGYDDGDYLATFNGTSAASPFVAGVAALVRSVAPALTNDEVRAVLQLSAVDMGDPGWDADTGHGRVNAYRALLLAQGIETPGEILVHNSGSIPLVLGGVTPDRPWINILSSPASVVSGGVGSINFSVDWNDPAFAAGLPIQAGIEIVSNDPDEQQLIVTVTAVPVAAACRPTWTVPLTVAGSSGTLVTLFGEGVNATEGLDAGCGERIATDGLSAFELPVGGTDSRTDIRAITGENVWTLALNGSDSYQLSWSSEDLPDGSFLLAAGNDVPVDMRAVQALTISDPLISSAVISRRDMVCIPFGRRPGWNLRTVPVAVGDASLRGAFPPALRAYELRGEYARVSEVESGRGYWTFFDGPTPNDSGFESICGRIVPSEERQIELVPGWNMIGTFEVPVGLSQLVTDPPGLLTDSVRTYYFGEYVAVDSLFPTVAYWVRSSGAGALRFAEPNSALESAFAAGPAAASRAAGFSDAHQASRTSSSGAAVEIVLGLRASNGDQLDLKFGLDPCATTGWDECVGEEILPPMPPKSSNLDASFAGDSDTRAQFACTGCSYGSSPNQRAKDRRFGLVDIRTGDQGA